MTKLFPILYIVTFVICIIFALYALIGRKNEDKKEYLKFASIGMVGRYLYNWLGDSSVPRNKENK